MGVTIQDIALKSQLSKPTVSQILNNKGGPYNAQTRARVLQLARDLNYRPNSAARATSLGRFDAIALLLSTIELRSILPQRLLDGIFDALAERNLRMCIAKLPDQALVDDGFVSHILQQWFADGLLINYNNFIPPHLIELVRAYGLPAVWINSKHSANCVYPDDIAGGYLATEYLIELGHRRIGFARFGGWDHYSAVDRHSGYAKSMQAAGLTPRLLQMDDASVEDFMAFAHSWLASPDRPTAVVVYADGELWPIYEAARRLNLKIGRDLSLIVYHEQPLSYVDAHFDTLVLPEEELGRKAVEMLLNQLSRPGQPLQPFVVAGKVHAGNTCGPARL